MLRTTIKTNPNSTVKLVPGAQPVHAIPSSNPTQSQQKAVQTANATRLRCEIASVQQAGPAKILSSPMHGATPPIDAFAQPPNLSPTPEAINRFMDEAGYDKQYIGAVYKQLDPTADPFDLGPEVSVGLKNVFQQKLDADKIPDSKTSAAASAEITPTGTFTDDAQELFYLRTSNTNVNEVLLRTREEIELHLMIENHLRVIGEPETNADVVTEEISQAEQCQPDEISLPSASASAPVRTEQNAEGDYQPHETRGPLGEPERAKPQDDVRQPSSRNVRCLQYTNDWPSINVNKLIADLGLSGVKIQKMGGENNNCWMRAAWLSSFIQCNDPGKLKQRLLDELNENLHEKNHPRPKPDSASTEGLPTIAEQINIIHNAILDFKNGRLEETHAKNAGPFKKAIDDAITVVSQALLLKDLKDKAPLNETIFNKAKQEIDGATTGNQMGSTEMIHIIMRTLGADMFVASLGCGIIEIGTAPDSALNEIDAPTANPTACGQTSTSKGYESTHEGVDYPPSTKVLEAARPLPALIHQNQHFDLYVPENLWRGRA